MEGDEGGSSESADDQPKEPEVSAGDVENVSSAPLGFAAANIEVDDPKLNDLKPSRSPFFFSCKKELVCGSKANTLQSPLKDFTSME